MAPLMPPVFFVVVVVAVVAALVVLEAAAVGFFATMVVVFVESLAELLRFSSLAGGTGGVSTADRTTWRDAGRVCFAATGAVMMGLAGLPGRGRKVLVGEAILIGDCGKVRELCDLGDKTCPGTGFRETFLVLFAGTGGPVVAVVLVRFLGFSRVVVAGCSFSLSEVWNTSLHFYQNRYRKVPAVGVPCSLDPPRHHRAF